MTINPNIIVDAVYPIGSIYITINSVNPSTLFGGTWKQITSDAYLKIVSSDAGELGGTSSSHIIGKSNLPNLEMPIYVDGIKVQLKTNIGGGGSKRALSLDGDSSQGNTYVQTEGDGEPYYPYYYGVYVWVRTA